MARIDTGGFTCPRSSIRLENLSRPILTISVPTRQAWPVAHSPCGWVRTSRSVVLCFLASNIRVVPQALEILLSPCCSMPEGSGVANHSSSPHTVLGSPSGGIWTRPPSRSVISVSTDTCSPGGSLQVEGRQMISSPETEQDHPSARQVGAETFPCAFANFDPDGIPTRRVIGMSYVALPLLVIVNS